MTAEAKLQGAEDIPSTVSLVPGVAAGSQPLYFRDRFAKGTQAIIHICHHDREMDQLAQIAPFFLQDVKILALPAWDCLPYDRVSPNHSVMAERIAALTALATASKNDRILLLTTVGAFLQRVPPVEQMQTSHFEVRKDGKLNEKALLEFLTHHGYHRTGKVMEPGEFAVRGNIIDLYPSSTESAIRIDLFGEDIESIREFDTMTQRSEKEIENITLTAASEVMLNPQTIERFRNRYREQFGAAHRNDALYASISAGNPYPGMEHWLPLFYDKIDNILSYSPDAEITLDHQLEKTFTDRAEMIADYYDARATMQKKDDQTIYNPLKPDMLYLGFANLDILFGRHQTIMFSPFHQPNERIYGQRITPLFTQAKQNKKPPLEQLGEELRGQQAMNRKLLIGCQTEGSRARVEKMLSAQHYHPAAASHWLQLIESGNSLSLAQLPLETGFSTEHVTIYSEQDIFGEKLIRTRKKKKPSEAFLQEAAAFETGELLVHREHGIGRFDGLETLEVGGIKHDCLKLLYKDDDRLFLPVENIELLSRYGSEEDSAELDKLGAGSWQARKARMKERIRMAAAELMKTAAERATRAAPALQAPDGMYSEFCEGFPFQETEDQERSIDETLADLSAGKPMDRLICGDVGFGKTEVALRAAFVAASDPHDTVQVALVAPTTLLVRQHYKNFEKRFEETGIKVAMLSRLTSAKDAKLIKEGLKDGSVRVVVGTHALFSDSVQFNNLGLVIVDEEQHFGVKQKEKLKSLKAGVHVLTLSATPIPRTLQLALSGVRDLSLITTPPVDRLAVRTFVMPFDPIITREAIMREIHRGGQVFYVTPRIADIGELKQKLLELVPEARLAVAHGQMAATDLDKVMNAFYDGQYDVLLSTAIIESGLDIPTANTIIINRADRFGLSQLYQLRGRVGRGKTRAYAYFTLPHQKTLTVNAVRRLEVMQTLDTLGAGFSLASHDMDIRGFGNLVGEEQSGHVREVGVELYQQMLEEAINNLKYDKVEVTDDWSPQINLGLSVMIPESYIEDLALRLSLYRRISLLQSDEEIESFAAELVDRFGPMPQDVENLLAIIRLKLVCKAAGIEKLDTGPKGAIIGFRDNKFAKPEALIGFIHKNGATMKIRPDQRIFCQQEYKNDQDKLRQTSNLIQQIIDMLN